MELHSSNIPHTMVSVEVLAQVVSKVAKYHTLVW